MMSRKAKIATALALFFCVLVFLYVIIKGAWLGDDPFITMRSVDNFVNGYGPVWNTDERVQAYTHPLWFLLLSAIYATVHEGYYSIYALCGVCSLAALVVAFDTIARLYWQRVLLTALLVVSCAWIDYAGSGLENSLSYLLLACFYGPLLRDDLVTVSYKRFAYFSFVASLGFMNRADACLLYAPALFALFAICARENGWKRALGIATATTLPAWGWLIFATIYYGFPFPNTAYSKLGARGVHVPLIHKNALLYFLNSFRWDPVTLTVIAASTLIAGFLFAYRADRWRVAVAAAGGIVLYLLYTLKIGGDYMSGRFFSMPFFIAALMAVAFAERAYVGVFYFGLVLSSLVMAPRSPLLRGEIPKPLPPDNSGIWDETAHYADTAPLIALREHRTPGHTPSVVGREFSSEHPKGMVWGAIGYFGFCTGPNVHIIDPIGLPDPLIARLPATNTLEGWGRGHLYHDIPDGYMASQELSENVIVDPNIHAYYDKLLIVTRGPLFSRQRFEEIYRLNTGVYDDLLLHRTVGASP